MPRQSPHAARALWYERPGEASLRPTRLVPPEADEAEVATLWSGLSRGTERLIFEGRVPQAEFGRMRAPLQEGDFPFPVKYGYCAVGRVEKGPDEWLGRIVFALHPHQDRFVAPVSLLSPVPDEQIARRAVLAANMETALNALWDSGAGPGERIAVVGAGVVGLLVAFLAARLPGAEVTVVDLIADRAGLAEALGARFATPEAAADVAAEADVVFHTSASAAGLATALSLGGLEATVVEMSWYGAGQIAAPLGEAFHSRRLKLVSSQVGQVSPARRPRWTHQRRLAKALALLDDARLDALIDNEVAFEDLPAALPRILSPRAPGLATVVRY
ncbi:MAG: zinc-binding alcohol dehydrogenase [Rhizobiales bacterium]|nr:zinc-binding alcohol dehydrogenase [Hyphomicrobiales bacterium]